MRADAALGAGIARTMRVGGRSPGFSAAGHGLLRGGVRGGVAVERACRGVGQLQHGACFCLGGDNRKIVVAAVARRGRIGAGFRIDELLSLARGL